MWSLTRDIKSILNYLLYFSVFLILGKCLCHSQLLNKDSVLKKIDVHENLGGKIPLNLSVVNSFGERKNIASFFEGGKPVLLVLAYYDCPMLCTFVLNGLSKSIMSLDWTPGIEYQILTISINHRETYRLAKLKKDVYIDTLTNKPTDGGWEFCVANEATIESLTKTLGFQYFYDDKQNEYAHPAVIFILTETGVISRYIYGLDYQSKDLKLALLEASNGKIGTIIDRVILFCYHYDPIGKKYTLMAMQVMRIGGVLTIVCIGILLGSLWIKENKHAKKRDV